MALSHRREGTQLPKHSPQVAVRSELWTPGDFRGHGAEGLRGFSCREKGGEQAAWGGQGRRGHAALFPSTPPLPLRRGCRGEEEQWVGKLSRWSDDQPPPRRSSAWLWGAALAMPDLCSWQEMVAIWEVVSAFSSSCSASPEAKEEEVQVKEEEAGKELWGYKLLQPAHLGPSCPICHWQRQDSGGDGLLALFHWTTLPLICFNWLSNLKPLSVNRVLSDIEIKLEREREKKKQKLEQ